MLSSILQFRAEEYPWSFFRHKRQNVLTERFRSITVTLNHRCTAYVSGHIAVQHQRETHHFSPCLAQNMKHRNTKYTTWNRRYKRKHKIQSKRNMNCNMSRGLCSNRLGRHIFHSVWDRGVEGELRRTFVLAIVLFVVVFVFISKLFCLWSSNNFWHLSQCVWQKSMTGREMCSLTAFSCCRRRRPTMPSVKYALLCHHCWGT